MAFRPRQLVFTKAAMRDFESMSLEDADAMANALALYAETGHGDVKKLSGRMGEWRLRCGKWRAIFTPSGEVLRVLRIRDRKEVYR